MYTYTCVYEYVYVCTYRYTYYTPSNEPYIYMYIKYTQAQQAKVFAQAAAVVGAHGSNLANLVWLQEGAAVVEVNIYVYLYVCMYIYVYIDIYICIHIHIYIYM